MEPPLCVTDEGPTLNISVGLEEREHNCFVASPCDASESKRKL